MPLDRLDALLQRFHLEARLFHAGPLCGSHDFDAAQGVGHLHLIRSGEVRIHNGGARAVHVTVPSLVLYPSPMDHRLVTDPLEGAQMACASVRFGAGPANPIVSALPPFVVIPIAALDGLGPSLELLFAEAFGKSCGRLAAVNRLFEVVLIQVLRYAMVAGRTSTGMLAGLANPGLARAMVAMHEKPRHEWTLEELAARAGMSRSRFAGAFRETVGMTPGNYLAEWRITVAQDLLRRGRALKIVAHEVGYGSPAALSRAFRGKTGKSPREWKGGNGTIRALASDGVTK